MSDAPPASWGALREALACIEPQCVQEAIVEQLRYTQPEGPVYKFLTRTLELANISQDAYRRLRPERSDLCPRHDLGQDDEECTCMTNKDD